MRRLAPARLKAGMVLARPIQDPGGRVLVRANMAVSDAAVNRIRTLGLENVYVEDARFAGLDLMDDVPPPLLRRSLQLFQQWERAFAAGSAPALAPAPVTQLVAAIEETVDPVAPLTLVRPSEESRYLSIQALNAARLCLAAAPHMKAGLHERDLAVAGLLRDIGMLGVPRELRLRPAALAPAELEVVRAHVPATLQTLQHPYWTPFVKVAVAQHHERADGSGYPEGRRGDELHPLGALLAAVDCYVALVAPRPQRPAYRPEEALEMLLGLADWQLSAPAVRAITACVGLYPAGTVVRLSTGDEAVVTHPGRGTFERPKVRLLDGGQILDLGGPDALSIQILSVVDG